MIHLRGRKSQNLQEASKAVGATIEEECNKYLADGNVQYPSYWKQHWKDFFGSKQVEIKSGTEVYKAVEKVIIGTWEATKVGHGRDAVNLDPNSTIAVRKIWCIENPALYQKYLSKKRTLEYQAKHVKPFPKVDGLKQEQQVKTHTLGMVISLVL